MLGHRSPAVGLVAVLAFCESAEAAPPVPSGDHPRLFLGSANLAAFQTMASTPGTSAAKLVAGCDDTDANPRTMRRAAAPTETTGRVQR